MGIALATQRTNGNGTNPPPDSFAEIGSLGLETISGFVQQAYHKELYWPGVYLLYNRLRRSDPEISVVRQLYTAMVGGVEIYWEGPEDPTPDDERAREFAESSLIDLEGGIDKFEQQLVSYVPFLGWGAWEPVPAMRRPDWQPPDPDDPWRSQFSDGLIAFRRLAWRDHSSFYRWLLDDATGRLTGMEQFDPPHPVIPIPINRLLHITFGDSTSPEGLTPLEAVWRLERIKYGLEIVQGIGYEHAAGYLNVNKTEAGDLTTTDKTNIKAAARAILTAQEGNYAAWPFGFEGEVKDVPFGAGATLLEAIRYYGQLKLTVYNAQWVNMAGISGTGSYAALKDSSSTWLLTFNSMLRDFISQFDSQYGARLFALNPGAFPGMTERPHARIKPADKIIDLNELGGFWKQVVETMPTGEDDYLAVRKRSGFLPEVTPEDAQPPRPRAPANFSALYKTIRARPVELQEGGDRSAYREAVYESVLKYLAASAPSRAHRNDIKQAIVEAFPVSFYEGYQMGGAEEVERDDDRWLTARITAEVGFVDALFESLKTIRDEELAPAELVAEAGRRADAYARTLDGVFSEGRLRGAKNKMLTMVGTDGEKSCRDCQARKGQRYSARKWLRLGIPGVPGNGYECGGWECKHELEDDDGNRWTA